MNEKVSAAGQREAVPSILSANVLYLLGIIMVLTAGVALQRAHFGWGLLATELLIGALAMLWVRLNRLPWRPTLRLTPATGRSLALAFFMGLGLWLLDSWLGAIMSFVLGYDVPVPPDMYPQNLPAAILLFVALGLGAPLGEELFFRGYLQRAYERMRPGLAIVLVALLFALFHLSLVGLTPRLPVALALGYVAWRSGSLWPGVALHAANNGAAVVFLAIIGLRPDLIEPLSSGAFALGGALAALLGLLLVVVTGWLFQRTVTARSLPQALWQTERRRRLLAALPLLPALLIYSGVAALELVNGRFPQLLAVEPLALQAMPWSEEAAWRYRLQHPGEETVGEASCTMTPAADVDLRGPRLRCALHHDPFEVRLGSSTWVGGDFTRHFAVVFDAADSRLQAIDDVREFDDAGYTVTAQAEGEDLVLQVEGANIGQSTERIQPPVLVDELWPWQLMALPFTTGASYEATLVFPQRFDATLERSALTVTDASVVIGGVEPLKVPAGNFFAWRVTVGEETAWYDAEPPHKLLQYDSGPVIWQLRATAAES